MAKAKTTTRSYTLALLAALGSTNPLGINARLFDAHMPVCEVAKEYGQLLLNLRGGLSATLAATLPEGASSRDRLLLRGTRRMLALGWLSVEDVDNADGHPHKVKHCATGASMHAEHAAALLGEILTTQGIEARYHAEWISDCVPALTASIRSDAVWVNRAAAFEAWRNTCGVTRLELAEQARRILWTLCGDGFVTLALPEEFNELKEGEETEADPESGATKRESIAADDDDLDRCRS